MNGVVPFSWALGLFSFSILLFFGYMLVYLMSLFEIILIFGERQGTITPSALTAIFCDGNVLRLADIVTLPHNGLILQRIEAIPP